MASFLLPCIVASAPLIFMQQRGSQASLSAMRCSTSLARSTTTRLARLVCLQMLHGNLALDLLLIEALLQSQVMCGIGLTLRSECCPQCHTISRPCNAKADGDGDVSATIPVGNSNAGRAEIHYAMSAVLADRGPDLTNQQYNIDIKRCGHQQGSDGVVPSECTCSWRLSLLASVLHMRGEELTPQPHVMEDEDDLFVLCWNGEVYSYDFSSTGANNIAKVSLDEVAYDAAEEKERFRSDTIDVMKIISSAVRNVRALPADNNMENQSEHEAISKAMGHIRGEYAFICYHKAKNEERESLYFGRDPLGRRSLLVAGGWPIDDDPPLSQLVLTSTAFSIGGKTPPVKELEAGTVFRLDLSEAAVEMSSVRLSRPKPNVSPVEHDTSYADRLKKEGIAESLVKSSETFHALLDRAVRSRVVNAPKPGIGDANDCGAGAASVGVLFSGGIDSVVLAAMCENHVPPEQPIDLINVAFMSDKIKISSSPDRAAALLSFEEMKRRWPNRYWRFIAVDIPYDEVLKNEERICRLISPLDSTMDFNIATAFWFASRGQGVEICRESNGSNGVLDAAQEQSTAGAAPLLRFASSQKSEVESQTNERTQDQQSLVRHADDKSNPIHYTSKARVLLVGIGADEQLAGYGRHRSVFNKGGYEALRAELEMERKRIWTRNLGRDDRVVSDHGKEARFPFLDEDLVGFLQSLDVLDICDMDRPQGEGDKLILRLVAKKIGVQTCSSLVKRAIQFGSRIAKCSDVDRFGSSRKAQGNSQHRHSNAAS